jgi:hypothetical protein
MTNQRNKIITLTTMLVVTALLAFAYTAFAGEETELFQPTDYKLMAVLPEMRSAAPVVTITSGWLSKKKDGSDIIDSIRPGETIYGFFKATLSKDSATLYRTYEIGMYDGLKKELANTFFKGSYKFSWGFVIPDDQAADGDAPTFYFKLKAVNGNTVASSLPFTVVREGIVDATRAYQTPITASVKTKILANVNWVKNLLETSSLKYDTSYYASSASSSAFITALKQHRPNATLIHANGSSVDGGRIILKDNTYINSTKVTSSFSGSGAKSKSPAGLFFAAVSEGAKKSSLGSAFVAAGYTAFIGYQTTVATDRNADFYKYFFEKATQPNVTVSAALNAAKTWALSKNPKWTDVATARIIGSGAKVYLGGKTSATPDQVETEDEEITIPVGDWTDINDMELGHYETLAVQSADQLPEVRGLKMKYGSNLAVGIEDLANIYRVAYKDEARGVFLYGVDLDKTTGQIVDEGPLD